MNKIRSTEQGFTLIEVLIASIILFSAIALVAELFSSASLSSKKAISVAQFNQAIPLVNRAIKAEVKFQSRNKQLTSLSGNETFEHINFTWQAERVSFLSPPMDPDDIEPWPPKFGLFNVIVIAEYKSKQKEYSFYTATW